MFYPFFIFYYILFTLLAWRRLNWAVLLIIATLPSYLIRFRVGPIPTTALEGMLLIVCILWLIKSRSRAKNTIVRFLAAARNLTINYPWPVVIFLLAATISLFVAPDSRAAAGIWKAYFIEPVLFFIILADLLRARVTRYTLHVTQIITALSITALLLSLYAIFQRLTGFGIPPPWNLELRVTSIFPYPNALGLFLAPLVPLFVGKLIAIWRTKTPPPLLPPRGGGLRWGGYWFIITGLSIAAIIFAQSTGAIVGVGAGLLVMLFFRLRFTPSSPPPSRGRIKVGGHRLAALGMMIILATLAILASPSLKDELLLRNWSGHVRKTQWIESWEMLKDRPLLGAGLAGYKEALAPYHKATYLEIFEYPHNIILNFWSETGLLGLAAFIGLMVVFFKKTWHRLKFPIPNSQFPIKSQTSNSQTLSIGHWGLVIGAVGAMITLLIHGLVDVPYFKNDLAILFWIIYALGIAI